MVNPYPKPPGHTLPDRTPLVGTQNTEEKPTMNQVTTAVPDLLAILEAHTAPLETCTRCGCLCRAWEICPSCHPAPRPDELDLEDRGAYLRPDEQATADKLAALVDRATDPTYAATVRVLS